MTALLLSFERLMIRVHFTPSLTFLCAPKRIMSEVKLILEKKFFGSLLLSGCVLGLGRLHESTGGVRVKTELNKTETT